MKDQSNQRILALDVGSHRVGMAISDPLGLTAQPLATLTRGAFKKDCAAISSVIRDFGVEAVILGLPIDAEGNEGRQCEKVRFFADGLQTFLTEHNRILPFHFVDESYSSIEAENVLRKGNVGRHKKKKLIDKMAAAIILQRYLTR